ncbi:hypothetical protein LEMLEM_LOCUS27005 [Lemmus lemmus]
MENWPTLISARPVDSLPTLSPAQTLFQELLIVLALPSRKTRSCSSSWHCCLGRLVVPVTPAYNSTPALEQGFGYSNVRWRRRRREKDELVLGEDSAVLHGYWALAVTTGCTLLGQGLRAEEARLSRRGWQRRATVLRPHHLHCLHTCPGLQARSSAKENGHRAKEKREVRP